MSARGTPGSEANINHQSLESHIPNRPFQFSNIPQGRGAGLNSSGTSTSKAYHTASSNLHRQAVAGTPTSELPPGNTATMKQEKENSSTTSGGGGGNASLGTPNLGMTGQASNSTANAAASGSSSSGTATTANGAVTKGGRAGGGASDFVKKLYRCVAPLSTYYI